MATHRSSNGTHAQEEESCPFCNLDYKLLQEQPRDCANKFYDHVVENVWKHSALTDESQYELARLLSITEIAKDDQLKQILPEIHIAIAAILSPNQKLQLARTIRYRLEMYMLDGPFDRRIIKFTHGNPVAIVGLGLLLTFLVGCTFLFVVPRIPYLGAVHHLLSLYTVSAPPEQVLQDNYLIAVVEAAFLGGIVSILMRLKDFTLLKDFDPFFVFFTGFLKPYIGVILGIFVYAFLRAGFIPIDQRDNGIAAVHIWWSVGFLSGFSERFAKDIISRSTGMLSSSKKSSQYPGM